MPTPITIAFARHGKAHPHSPTGQDRDRELKDRGERQATFLGQALSQLACAPTLIITSPFARARRTAELIGKELAVPMRIDDELASGASAGAVLETALAACQEDASARPLIVGHNPTLEYVLALLTAGPGGDLSAMRHVRTGEAFVLSIPDATNPIGNANVVEALRLGE